MKERRILIILIIIFLLFAFATLLTATKGMAEDGYFILCFPGPGSMVNVHEKPLISSRVTAWVECGQQIETDGQERNGFVHVIGLASEEPDGWIYSGYIVDEQPRIETYKAEVWDGPVIVRRSVNGKRIRRLKDGQEVTVYAQTHTWAVTDKGFIMCDWLRENEQ